jgi:hypothetical protein
MINQIVVGNIGQVLDCDSFKECLETYHEYVKQSKNNYGRAAGESVTWFKNGEIYKEYVGTIDSRED